MHKLLGKIHPGVGSRHQCGTVAEHGGRLSRIRPADHPAGSDGAAEHRAIRQHGAEHRGPAHGDLRQGSRHVYPAGEPDLAASDLARRSVGDGRDIPQHLRRIGQDGLPGDAAPG